MSETWTTIPDQAIVNVWEDDEGNEHRVYPSFYAEAGTPVSENGNDMVYIRSEVLMVVEGDTNV